MKKFVFMFFVAYLTAPSSYAQFMLAEGEFESKSVQLKTLLLDSEKGVVAASAVVTQGPCSGSLAGIGKMAGKTLSIEPYVKVEGGGQCKLQVIFDREWTHVKIVEGEGCSAYHGASCGWEGQEAKRKSR